MSQADAAIALARRIMALTPGEYMIHLDTTHRGRPRWKITPTPAKWESAHHQEEEHTPCTPEPAQLSRSA